MPVFSFKNNRIFLCKGGALVAKRLRSSWALADPSVVSRKSVDWEDSDGDVIYKMAKKFELIPGPVKLPVLGTLWTYKTGRHRVEGFREHLCELHAKYGPIARDVLGDYVIVRVFSPADVEKVLNADGKYPAIPPLQETAKLFRSRRGYGLGLGNTNGHEWYVLRSVMQKVLLKPLSIQSYLPSVNAVGDDFLRRIKDDRHKTDFTLRGMRDLIGKWHMENAAAIAFERRLGILDRGEAEAKAQRMIDVNKVSFKLSAELKFSLPVYKYFQTPKWRELERCEEIFYKTAVEFSKEPLEEVKNLLQKGSLDGSRFNFLLTLLSHTGICPKEATMLCLSLQSDGLTATVPTVLYILYSLARNPLVQDKLYQEVTEVVPPTGEITADALSQLHYLKAVIKETLRLLPLNTETSRITQENLVLSGYQIPSGTHIDINTIVHYRSSDHFLDSNSFRPERWLNRSGSNGEVSPNAFTFTPFGHGPRMCVARRFAEQDMHTIIAKIVRRFRVGLSPGEPELRQKYNTVLLPAGDPSFVFQDRN